MIGKKIISIPSRQSVYRNCKSVSCTKIEFYVHVFFCRHIFGIICFSAVQLSVRCEPIISTRNRFSIKQNIWLVYVYVGVYELLIMAVQSFLMTWIHELMTEEEFVVLFSYKSTFLLSFNFSSSIFEVADFDFWEVLFIKCSQNKNLLQKFKKIKCGMNWRTKKVDLFIYFFLSRFFLRNWQWNARMRLLLVVSISLEKLKNNLHLSHV